MSFTNQPAPDRILARPTLINILQAALSAGEFRYARRAALAWLALFPGDLKVQLLHVKTILNETRPEKALPVLESICHKDPEYEEAQTLLAKIYQSLWHPRHEESKGLVYVLNSNADPKSLRQPRWAPFLRSARQAYLQSRQLNQKSDAQAKGKILLDYASKNIHQALLESPSTPLAAVLHLAIVAANSELPQQSLFSLAQTYQDRWPECLQCKLILADLLIDRGQSDQAVDLLHQAAAQDVVGQVPGRMWGENFPYKNLWPERLEIFPGSPNAPQNLPIPAAVAGMLGWNRLPLGENSPVPMDPLERKRGTGDSHPVKSMPSWQPSGMKDMPSAAGSIPATNLESEPGAESNQDPVNEGAQQTDQNPPAEAEVDGESLHLHSAPVYSGNETPEVPHMLTQPNQSGKSLTEDGEIPPGYIRHLKDEKMEETLDGRFPIYIVFTTRQGLVHQYGEDGALRIERAMLRLVEAVNMRKRWGAALYYADDPQNSPGLANLGLQPVLVCDPWRLKLALVDLDAALTQRGEMIGAVLILGGSEVVPFHKLPNPVDDLDVEVNSDNPYSTRDENYFLPEWPLGRLPGGAGNDPTFLLQSLQRMAAWHIVAENRRTWVTSFQALVRQISNRLLKRNRIQSSLGYTAAVWQRVSLSIYRSLGGNPRHMWISPPIYVNGNISKDNQPLRDAVNTHKHSKHNFSIPASRLGYFNLHGVPDSSVWYGQKDLMDQNTAGQTDLPDFPVALRPQDLDLPNYPTNLRLMEFVFSEACYGADICDKTPDESLALKFLEKGSLAVVGSTSTAYGSITTPLIDADLLGRAYWHYLGEGYSAGDALRRAKIKLVQEMERRQGYLDGEDQKTLISFVLYGDPLAQFIKSQALPQFRRSKANGILRRKTQTPAVITVCDRAQPDEINAPIPPETLERAKHLAAQYLPGMEDAEYHISKEHALCNGYGHNCPTAQIGPKIMPDRLPNRQVITLSKTIHQDTLNHYRYARMTFNSQGKLVKLVVSR